MAKNQTIKFVVVTPERQVVEDTAESVVIPAHDGELGVLALRAPLMCELGIGQMRYTKAGQTGRVFIDGGFAQVHDDTVTILTENAAAAADITAEMIADAEKSADEITGTTPEDIDARGKAAQRVSVMRSLQGSH